MYFLDFVSNATANAIDRWFLQLTEKFNGFGMILYVILTLIISGLFSGLIGLERYRSGENAGMRTHALLAIGCSFLMTISIWAIRIPDPTLDYDISRIAAGAVTGIGFLGAGVIIKDKFTIRGLSTATTLWICAAIGLATGAGFVLEAFIATIITLLVVLIRNKLIVRVDKNAPHIEVKAKSSSKIIEIINDACNNNSINLKNLDVSEFNNEYIVVKAYFPYKTNPLLLEYLMNYLKQNEDIVEVSKIMKKDNVKYNGPHES